MNKLIIFWPCFLLLIAAARSQEAGDTVFTATDVADSLLIPQQDSIHITTWALGVQAGEPFGLSLRYYLGKANITFMAGFTGYLDWNTHRFDYDDRQPVPVLSVQYLKERHVSFVPHLFYQYGGGVLFHAATYDSSTIDFRVEKRTFLGAGLQANSGLVYRFKALPIHVYVEATPYVEVAPAPLELNILGGVGIRYEFRLRLPTVKEENSTEDLKLKDGQQQPGPLHDHVPGYE